MKLLDWLKVWNSPLSLLLLLIGAAMFLHESVVDRLFLAWVVYCVGFLVWLAWKPRYGRSRWD